MSNNWYPCSVLTGGAAGALDELNGTALNDGDRAIVIADDKVYFYILDADSGLAESAPDVISPDTNAGTKRWLLKKIFGGLLYDDGDSAVASGLLNAISGSGGNNFIGGGWNNTISDAWYCAILGGDSNSISINENQDCAILSGSSNSITSTGEQNTIVAGYDNSIGGGGDYGVCSGYKNQVEADHGTVLGGREALAYLFSQVAYASGRFSAYGDAQISTLVARAITTDDTETELFLDGSAIRAVVKAWRTWKFKIHLVARQYSGAAGAPGDSALWEVSGAIKRDGSNNTALIGTPQGTGVPALTNCDPAIAAQGTITMSGVAVADETFVVGSQTFTWKASRSTTGEVVIGSTASGAVANIVTAITADLTTVTAVDGDGDTVIVTAAAAGSSGNSIIFTESSTNMAVDGSGALGGTTEGKNVAGFWNIDVTADDTNESLKIAVTGEVGKTIHWVAKIELVEVG